MEYTIGFSAPRHHPTTAWSLTPSPEDEGALTLEGFVNRAHHDGSSCTMHGQLREVSSRMEGYLHPVGLLLSSWTRTADAEEGQRK